MDLLLAHAPGFLLTLVRTSALVAAIWLLGHASSAHWPKLVLAIVVSLLLYARAPRLVAVGDSLLVLGLAGAREAILGFALGLAVESVLLVLQVVGDLIGHEMGFDLAQIVDPVNGTSSAVVARFFEVLCLLYVLAVDGHHEAFRLLAATFDSLPVGAAFDLGALERGLLALFGDGLVLALRLAAPVYAVMVVLSVVLVVIARAVPQLNLLEFGYTVRVLVGLLALVVFLTQLAPRVHGLLGDLFGRVHEIVRAIA